MIEDKKVYVRIVIDMMQSPTYRLWKIQDKRKADLYKLNDEKGLEDLVIDKLTDKVGG